jgi:serine protease Do
MGGVVWLFLAGLATIAWSPAAQSPAWGDAPDGAIQFRGTAPPASVADFKAMERQIHAVLDKVTSSVVALSGGSGVVVSEDGYVLTVAHVGSRAGRSVTVTFPDGRRARAKTLGNDHGVDAGLVKIAGDGPWPHVEMGHSDDLQPGEWCLALGYPVTFERGKAPVVRIGRVLRDGPTAVITDAAIMGGDSGGPLFDLEGKVIAIGSSCDQAVRTNIFVPIDCYRENWDRLAAAEDFNSRLPDVAFLGVAPREDGDDARIGQVIPGSGADKAGIRPGDVILSFDGEKVLEYADLTALIRKRKPGDRVEIELRRGEKTLTVEAYLGRQGY